MQHCGTCLVATDAQCGHQKTSAALSRILSSSGINFCKPVAGNSIPRFFRVPWRNLGLALGKRCDSIAENRQSASARLAPKLPESRKRHAGNERCHGNECPRPCWGWECRDGGNSWEPFPAARGAGTGSLRTLGFCAAVPRSSCPAADGEGSGVPATARAQLHSHTRLAAGSPSGGPVSHTGSRDSVTPRCSASSKQETKCRICSHQLPSDRAECVDVTPILQPSRACHIRL